MSIYCLYSFCEVRGCFISFGFVFGHFLRLVLYAAKNGCYVRLVQKVRDAFEQNEVVRIDCTGMETSDHKKIGAKLRVIFICSPFLCVLCFVCDSNFIKGGPSVLF